MVLNFPKDHLLPLVICIPTEKEQEVQDQVSKLASIHEVNSDRNEK